MKVIKKEEKIYKFIYESVDGKKFNRKEDCEAWENSREGTLEARWNKINKIEANSVALGLPYNSDDHEVWIVKPKNLEEVDFLNAYIECVACIDSDHVTTDMIGKEIALNFGCERDYCDVYVLEKYIQSLKNEVARVAKEIENKEEE